MSGHGILYGVGVGPGDPELVTLKAYRILQATRHVAYFAKQGKTGNARRIAGPHLREDHQTLRLEYPFTIEIPVDDADYQPAMDRFYDAAAARVARHLASGQDVAVLCEGDPFFYGSYMYLHQRLARDFSSEIVPGVPGMSGCWALAGTPITQRDDVLTVLPGTLPAEELRRRLADSDAAVIMKVGRNLPAIRAALAAVGALERAILVERGTMPGERIAPLTELGDDRRVPYFSIVLVPGCRGLQ